MEEIWKDIIIEKNGVIYDYTGLYEVSNLGMVKNSKTGRILKPRKSNRGYLYVDLSKDGKQERFSIFKIQLKKRKQDCIQIDFGKILPKTEGFSGAEK